MQPSDTRGLTFLESDEREDRGPVGGGEESDLSWFESVIYKNILLSLLFFSHTKKLIFPIKVELLDYLLSYCSHHFIIILVWPPFGLRLVEAALLPALYGELRMRLTTSTLYCTT